MRKTTALLLSCLTAFSVIPLSASLADADEGLVIREGQLENGMKVYFLKDDRANVIMQMVTVRAGGADDPIGKSGLAHLLEHMMFRGTKDNPDDSLKIAFSRIGANYNAFTSDDMTGYYEQAGADQLEVLMRLDADRFAGLSMKPEEVITEAQVVVQERLMRVENDPSSRLREVVKATLFSHHPYGVPVVGLTEEINAITPDDAMTFYRRYYHPDNAFVIVAGNSTWDEVMALAEKTYGVIRADQDFRPNPKVKEPEPIAARQVSFTDPQVAQPTLTRYYLLPAFAPAGRDEATASLLAQILGSGATSRLYQGLVLDDKQALHAGSFLIPQRDYSQFVLYALPVDGVDFETLSNLLNDKVADLAAKGVTEDELSRARRLFLADEIYKRDEAASVARDLGGVLARGGTVNDYLSWPDQVRAVTRDDIQTMAKTWLLNTRSVTGYLDSSHETPTALSSDR